MTFLSESDDYRCCLDQKGRFKNSKEDFYELGLVEEEDLPDVSRFIVQNFGAEAISLSKDLSSFEELLMRPAANIVNGYSGLVAFAEVLAGLRSRLSLRLQKGVDISPPNLKGLSREEQIRMAESTSVVLALSKKSPGKDNWHSDVIASIELRLQPCDAKIPFSLPWIDRIERGLASLIGLGKNHGRDLQPYLSNLCVEESYRGLGIGRDLVRCVENIACTTWHYNRMYLHVDHDNAEALKLYKSEGYRDVGLRWKPFWAGKAAEIGYYVKNLKVDAHEEEEAQPRTKKKKKAREET
jgi:ribosomal protein S18 acetylase RimI-like enzyme